MATADRPAEFRPRPASLADLDPAALARRVRARSQAEDLALHAVPDARLVGLQAQLEHLDEVIRWLLNRLRCATEQEPAAAAALEPRSLPLEDTLSALAAEIADRLANARAASRPATAAQRAPAPSPPASLGTPPEQEEAALEHPAVLRALCLRDQKIHRLPRALIESLGDDRAWGYIFNVVAAPLGPVFPPAPSPAGALAGAAPGVNPLWPPWSQPSPAP